MKKLLFILLAVVSFAACEDYNDQFYDELDEQGRTDAPVTLEYSLTAEDYATIAKASGQDWVEEDMFLNASVAPADYIPAIITEKFTGLGLKSAVKVTYNYSGDMPEDLSTYTTTDGYSLEADDYTSPDDVLEATKYFSPNYSPDVFIPAILENKVTGASEGDLVLVEYKYSDAVPQLDYSKTGYEELAVEDFNQTAGSYTAVSTIGDEVWGGKSYDDGCLVMTGYVSGSRYDNQDWLISPAYDLSAYAGARVILRHAINYQDDFNLMKVLVSTDYDGAGDPTTATWQDVFTPDQGSSWSFYDSEIDLSAFTGEASVYIAFRYESSATLDDAATWEISKATVEVASGPEVIGKDPMNYKSFYKKTADGWEIEESAYYLNASDYDAMGDATGSHDNFSNSADPRDYLPNFLKTKYPLAGEGAEVVLVYKYYVGGGQTKTLASRYTMQDGAWATDYNYIIATTEQYAHFAEGWKFDPTVRYTMVSEDYQMIVDVVKTTHPDLVSSYGNNEYYYGANAYYVNFDVKPSNREGQDDFDALTTDEAKAAYIDDKLNEGIIVFLKAKFPDAVTQVNGVDVFYEISYALYGGDAETGTKKFQCTKAGPNPEFTFVE